MLVGICILPRDLDPTTFTYTIRSQDVTVAGFRVVGFGDGILGFGTRNLHIFRNVAVDNEGYGMASFDGIGSTIAWQRRDRAPRSPVSTSVTRRGPTLSSCTTRCGTTSSASSSGTRTR